MLELKHNQLRSELRIIGSNFKASGQGDDDVKEGRKFGSDFRNFCDYDYQYYAYCVFIKYDLFSSCVEAVPAEAAASSTKPVVKPAPTPRNSKKPTTEPEDASPADKFFLKKLSEDDAETRAAKKTIVLNSARASTSDEMERTSKYLTQLYNDQHTFKDRNIPCPPHIQAQITIASARLEHLAHEVTAQMPIGYV
jgi:hypothetical protein